MILTYGVVNMLRWGGGPLLGRCLICRGTLLIADEADTSLVQLVWFG